MDESNGLTELRSRSEEPWFLDLDLEVLSHGEEFALELAKSFRLRMSLYSQEKEAEKEMKEFVELRKECDEEILDILYKTESDGVSRKGILLDRIYNKGRESWDANYLRKVLTPEQMTTAKKLGTPYVYLKTTQLKD